MADAPDTLFGADIPGGAKALGALLWRYATAGDGAPFVWPAVTTLSRIMGQDATTTRRQLKALSSAGLAIEDRRYVARAGRTVRGWGLTGEVGHARPEPTRAPTPDAPGAHARATGHARPPNRAPTPIEAPVSPKEASKKPQDPAVETLAALWRDAWTAQGVRVRITAKVRKAIAKGLADQGEEECQRLLKGHSLSSHHLEGRYTNPDYAFRESNFSRFQELASETKGTSGPPRDDVLGFWLRVYRESVSAFSDTQHVVPWPGTWNRPHPPVKAAKVSGWHIPLWDDPVLDLHSTNMVAARRASKATRDEWPDSPTAERVASEGFQSAKEDFEEAHKQRRAA